MPSGLTCLQCGHSKASYQRVCGHCWVGNVRPHPAASPKPSATSEPLGECPDIDEIRICPIKSCGKSYRSKRRDRRFCSYECRREGRIRISNTPQAIFVNEHKLAHPCECGEADPDVLQFHHRDRSTKAFSISWGIRNKLRLDVIKAEVAKCDVLCANCHLRLEAALRRAAEPLPKSEVLIKGYRSATASATVYRRKRFRQPTASAEHHALERAA